MLKKTSKTIALGLSILILVLLCGCNMEKADDRFSVCLPFSPSYPLFLECIPSFSFGQISAFSIDILRFFHYNVCNEIWVFRNLFHKFGW